MTLILIFIKVFDGTKLKALRVDNNLCILLYYFLWNFKSMLLSFDSFTLIFFKKKDI